MLCVNCLMRPNVFQIFIIIIIIIIISVECLKKYTFFSTGCGSVTGNTLTSPGYPIIYPNNMDCIYQVPIPDGMAMKIDFRDFHVGFLSTCE